MTALAAEIKKRNAFDLLEEEAYLNLWKTFAQLSEDVDRLLRTHALCPSHYNVLRTLAGEKAAGSDGLAVLELRDRLITRVPDITRLTDKLVELGHLKRIRSETDRRKVLLCITPKGQRLVSALSRPIATLHQGKLGHMTSNELTLLSSLLVKARRS